MRLRALFPTAAVVLAASVSISTGVQVGPVRATDEVRPTPAPTPPVPELVPAAKLRKAVRARDHYRELAKARADTLRTGPDFEISIKLAAIAYGQDWRHLYACALSEGSRIAERFTRHNYRPNSAGSGAYSSFQFMRGTFLSTPFAAFDWSRQDVQAHAAAWMFAQGRSREWTGAGC